MSCSIACMVLFHTDSMAKAVQNCGSIECDRICRDMSLRCNPQIAFMLRPRLFSSLASSSVILQVKQTRQAQQDGTTQERRPGNGGNQGKPVPKWMKLGKK